MDEIYAMLKSLAFLNEFEPRKFQRAAVQYLCGINGEKAVLPGATSLMHDLETQTVHFLWVAEEPKLERREWVLGDHHFHKGELVGLRSKNGLELYKVTGPGHDEAYTDQLRHQKWPYRYVVRHELTPLSEAYTD